MRITSLLFLAASATATLEAILESRDSNPTEEYLRQVCFPNTTAPIVPPCQSIENIALACQPNGTSSLALQAHAECMCGGSYFSDWVGCLNCDYVHGARSPQIVSAFNTIITSASHALCTGTPTASFQAIFSSISEGVAATGTATAMSDQFPSQTAISLYFTLSGKQGPGAITGSATAATAQVTTTSASSGTTGAKPSGTGTSNNGGSSSSAGAQNTSSSKAAAAPTGIWMGALGALAGGAAILAL